MTPNVTLAGRKSDHNLQIEGSLSETRGKESLAQNG